MASYKKTPSMSSKEAVAEKFAAQYLALKKWKTVKETSS